MALGAGRGGHFLQAASPAAVHHSCGQYELRQITEGFRGIYDTPAVSVAVAQRMREVGDLATASEVARQAIKVADPAAWSRTHGDAIRRQAWRMLTTIAR